MLEYHRIRNPLSEEYQLFMTGVVDNKVSYLRVDFNNGTPVIKVYPCKDNSFIPAHALMNPKEFHRTRHYLEGHYLENSETITEEQAKAEETIGIDSGFNFLKVAGASSLKELEERMAAIYAENSLDPYDIHNQLAQEAAIKAMQSSLLHGNQSSPFYIKPDGTAQIKNRFTNP